MTEDRGTPPGDGAAVIVNWVDRDTGDWGAVWQHDSIHDSVRGTCRGSGVGSGAAGRARLGLQRHRVRHADRRRLTGAGPGQTSRPGRRGPLLRPPSEEPGGGAEAVPRPGTVLTMAAARRPRGGASGAAGVWGGYVVAPAVADRPSVVSCSGPTHPDRQGNQPAPR